MVYMFHVFIFYFTGDGHLGCFHVLAIVNSDAVTIGVYLLELRFIQISSPECDAWVICIPVILFLVF